MEQKKIWDYFQGEGAAAFEDAAPRFRFLVRRASSLVRRRPRAALNIGIGSGVLERTAREAGWDVSGCDPTEIAVAKLKEMGLPARVGTLAGLPFDDGQFDVVFASEVFEHVAPDHFRAGLGEIHRVLRPSGWLLGTVPADENLSLSDTVCPDCGKRFHRWGHVQSFSASTLRAALELRFGNVTIQVRAFPDLARPAVKDKIKSVIKWGMGRFGAAIVTPNLYFAAQKR